MAVLSLCLGNDNILLLLEYVETAKILMCQSSDCQGFAGSTDTQETLISESNLDRTVMYL